MVRSSVLSAFRQGLSCTVGASLSAPRPPRVVAYAPVVMPSAAGPVVRCIAQGGAGRLE